VRVAVDTNLTVSAMINPAGFPARVMAAFAAGRFTLETSEPLLEELGVKLCLPRIRRRTGLTPGQVADLTDAMRELAEVVAVTGEVKLCRDPNDDRVIETALKGRADVLVSRDEDLTRAPEVWAALGPAGVRVLTVARFLAELDAGDDVSGREAEVKQGIATCREGRWAAHLVTRPSSPAAIGAGRPSSSDPS
jgi:putative PIN family toxin of toxin-antitoxin system